MKQTVEFDFTIGQEVKIVAIGMVGIVQNMLVGPQTKEYQVVFWNESKRESNWLYAYEIKEIN